VGIETARGFAANTEDRLRGIAGEPRDNVLELNLKLDSLK